MEIHRLESKQSLARAAARIAATKLREAIASQEHAYFIAATGVSQFDFLAVLIQILKFRADNWKSKPSQACEDYGQGKYLENARFMRLLTTAR